MDFLDPRKRRAHKIRLIVGYVLVAIAIGLASVVLYYAARGYSIDRKTGEIIQNGLLFVDSHPGAADIYLNGKRTGSATAARLVLPAGAYDLVLKKQGYRDWERKFVLDGSTVARYVYPFLFPIKPVTAALKSYTSIPPILTESPDRHWLLAMQPTADFSSVVFDEYDTSNLTQTYVTSLTLPSGLLTNLTQPNSALSVVEWSTDNNHLLLEHSFQGGSEFIVFNRSDPNTSFNVNKFFKTDPTKVALRDKKVDQLYLYDQKSQTLSLGDTSSGTVGAPILEHVLDFKPYGANIVSYITDSDMPAGKVQARFFDSGKTYPLAVLNTGSVYLLDIAEFQSHIYYVVGSNTTERILIFQDPLSDIQDPKTGRAVAFFSLKDPGSTVVGFSANARFVYAEAGANFASYDFEQQMSYQYTLQQSLGGSLQWMDGHRLIGEANGSVFVTDYDGTNEQLLTSTVTPLGGYFSRDYNQMFTLAPQSASAAVTLERVDLRAGADLPKTP